MSLPHHRTPPPGSITFTLDSRPFSLAQVLHLRAPLPPHPRSLVQFPAFAQPLLLVAEFYRSSHFSLFFFLHSGTRWRRRVHGSIMVG